MTNAEKYLKEEVDINELSWELYKYLREAEEKNREAGRQDICNFFYETIKPTLTEDERVILRNINTNNYDKVGRKISGALYLRIANEIGIDSTFEDFFQDSDLFQFIKERRRI